MGTGYVCPQLIILDSPRKDLSLLGILF